MTKTKAAQTDMAQILEEERQDATKATKTAPAAPKAKETPKVMGRPKSKPDSKQTSFNLSLTLIDRIGRAADKYTGENKSLLVSKAVEEFLEKRGE
jgi:hypothetical protein